MSDFRKHLEKRLKDVDFRKEYEALEPECAAIRASMTDQQEQHMPKNGIEKTYQEQNRQPLV